MQRKALAWIAAAALLALTLWFSASAVAPQLTEAWSLSSGEVAWLTLTVQIGFVLGAFAIAATGVADFVPARRLFTVSAVGGAVVNAGLVLLDGDLLPVALGLRLLTGVALAGVYPSALKVMSGWFAVSRGMALGTLVGALTIGSAGPHLIRGIGLEWQGVILGASLLTLGAAAIMTLAVGDGPHDTTPPPFSWRLVGAVVANRGVRLSTYGYLGHMWELYAMWTWTGAFLAASALAAGLGTGWVPAATFLIIAVGGPGSWWAGIMADRYGRTVVAGGAMAVSGSCALLSPLVFGASPWIVVGLFLVWGVTIVADSAQFSTMVTETADDELRGTALTLQTGLGFLLTLVTIRGVPIIAESVGWQWAFPWLAIGPAFGVAAMVILRRSPLRAKLAGGAG
jgi:MFS family permease